MEKAKQALENIRLINKRIEKMKQHIEALKASALDKAIAYDKARVQSSPTNFTEQVLIDAFDAEQELEEYMASCEDIKLHEYWDVKKLTDKDEQDAILFYYFDGLAWEEVAAKMSVSESRVYEIRQNALENYAKIKSWSRVELNGVNDL